MCVMGGMMLCSRFAVLANVPNKKHILVFLGSRQCMGALFTALKALLFSKRLEVVLIGLENRFDARARYFSELNHDSFRTGP